MVLRGSGVAIGLVFTYLHVYGCVLATKRCLLLFRFAMVEEYFFPLWPAVSHRENDIYRVASKINCTVISWHAFDFSFVYELFYFGVFLCLLIVLFELFAYRGACSANSFHYVERRRIRIMLPGIEKLKSKFLTAFIRIF